MPGTKINGSSGFGDAFDKTSLKSGTFHAVVVTLI